MGLLSSLLRTSLPDVGSEHFAATCKNNVGASMVRLKLYATITINNALNAFPDEIYIFWYASANFVQYTFSNLQNIRNVDSSESLDFH